MSAPARNHRKRSQERYAFSSLSYFSNPKQILWVKIPPVSFGNFAHPHGCTYIKPKQHIKSNNSMTSINNLLNLPYLPTMYHSDPTSNNWDKSKHRRDNRTAHVVFEGPAPPPELNHITQLNTPKSQDASAGTGDDHSITESDHNSDNDTNIEDADSQGQHVLSDKTQTALWTMGNQLETMGLASGSPFQEMIDIIQNVKPLTQQFLDEMLSCDAGYVPPIAPERR